MTTGSPARTVWRTLPISSRPAKGVLRLRLARADGSTTQRRAGSITHRLAGAPGLTGPPWAPDRPAMAAGCQDMRASTRSSGRPELVSSQAERGLEPDHPGARLAERHLLGLGRVGRVVGGDGVYRPVGQARMRSAATSAAVRSGGFTLNTGS